MSSKTSAKAADPSASVVHRIAWLLMAGLWVFAAASLISFSPADPPSHAAAPLNDVPANWCGRIGALMAYKVYVMFGIGSWVVMAGLAAVLFAAVVGRKIDQLPVRVVGVAMVSVAFAGLLALTPLTGSLPEGPGGLLSIYLVGKMQPWFATWGTVMAFSMLGLIGLLLAADDLMTAFGRGVGRLLGRVVDARGTLGAICRSVAAGVSWAVAAPVRGVAKLFGGRRRSEVEEDDEEEDWEYEDAEELEYEEEDGEAEYEDDEEYEDAEELEYEEEEEAPKPRKKRSKPKKKPARSKIEAKARKKSKSKAKPEAQEADAPRPFDPQALREKIKNLPISFAAKNKPAAAAPPPKQDLSGYKFPGMDLLIEPDSDIGEEMAALVRQQAESLEKALHTYKIDGEVVAIDAGPTITMYEVQLAPGTKVSQLNALSSDLARELKAQNIRIVSNIAGKSTVGIEVPNLKKERVRLKELMLSGGADAAKMDLPMFLGKDASGNPLIADLAKMPHMLIAGTTGSGKSVCMNSIIMSFLFVRRPDELKLVLVDPKMVEMAQFRDIPHLMCPVVTEMNRAAAILEWAVTQMEERYSLLAEAGTRDINGYNAMSWEEKKERFNPSNEAEEAKIPKKLPRMVFVIDELADLMMTNKEVENFIVRIAQKARAVGIHLILATQRPQANVVTGLIKSNMPCRVSFKVSSGMDSRIVLDSKGAELLLGQGDMLYLSPRTSKLTRAQGTLVDEGECRNTVKFLKAVAEQCFEPQLIQLKAPGGAGGEDGEVAERDPLFDDAVRIVLETRRGSVSLLQRRLAVGYSRASRLIEQIAEAGIIGEYKGSQAREVNFTLEEWEALKAQVEAETVEEEVIDTVEQAEMEAEYQKRLAEAKAEEEAYEAAKAQAEQEAEEADEDVDEEDDVEMEADAEDEEYEEDDEEEDGEAEEELEYEEDEDADYEGDEEYEEYEYIEEK